MGLVQKVFEAAGLSTVTLSTIWQFTASVGAPRVAAIAYPQGVGFGVPGDAEGQRAVLRSTFDALWQITDPGGVVHLPFKWKRPRSVRVKPKTLPPIAKLVMKRPWLLKRFIDGRIPDS